MIDRGSLVIYSTLKYFLIIVMSLVGNMIRYSMKSPAAMSNFQNFSGGDISELALKAWKERPEKREESKNEDKG